MRQDVKNLLMGCACAAVLGLGTTSFGATYTWSGATTNQYYDQTKWTPNLPAAGGIVAGDTVIVSPAVTGQMTIQTGFYDPIAGNLTWTHTNTAADAQGRFARQNNDHTARPLFIFDNLGAESVVTVSQNRPFGAFGAIGFQFSASTAVSPDPIARYDIVLKNDVRFTSGTDASMPNGLVYLTANTALNSNAVARTVTVEAQDSSHATALRMSSTVGNNVNFLGTWNLKGTGFSATADATTGFGTTFNTTTQSTNSRLFVQNDDFGNAANGVVLKGGTLDFNALTLGTFGGTWARALSGTGVVEMKVGTPLTLTGSVNLGPSALTGGPDEINVINSAVSISGATLNLTGSYAGPGPYTLMYDAAGITGQFSAANLSTGTLQYDGTSVVLLVPEPTSLGLLGLGGLMLMRRKSRVA